MEKDVGSLLTIFFFKAQSRLCGRVSTLAFFLDVSAGFGNPATRSEKYPESQQDNRKNFSKFHNFKI